MSQPVLPPILPLFPLTGVLLLPGMWLPLHIFESRYRHMVEDARDSQGWIAMVQPVVPQHDNSPPPEAVPENPPIYPVGCAGRMERCEESPDGRFAIALKGVTRFRLKQELSLHRGYRRAVPDYAEFAADRAEEEAEVNVQRLKRALEAFGARQNLPFDLAKLEAVPGIALLNGLCMSLPFAAAEKQALLEAPTPAARERMLLGLMGIGLDPRSKQDGQAAPTLN